MEQTFIVKGADDAIRKTELVPIAGSDFSIAPALQIAAQLVPFQEAAAELEAQAGRAKIDSPIALQNGVEFLSICADQYNQLEAYRKATTGPVYDYWKYMNSLFKPLQERIEAAKKRVSGLMITYRNAEDAKERERQERLRKQQEEDALKMAAERESAGDTKGAAAIIEAATTAPVIRPNVTRTVPSSSGRAFSTRKVWTADVEQPMEVLKAIIDGKLPISIIAGYSQIELNKVAKQIGVVTKVNGLKIYQDETGGVR